MLETNLHKLLDVLQAQKSAADGRIKYYDSMLESHPNDAEYKRFKCVALAEYYVLDTTIHMVVDRNTLDRVYSIWFDEP